MTTKSHKNNFPHSHYIERNDHKSGQPRRNDDSRDDRQIVLDDATRDMTKMELRILCAKLKDKCNAGETKLKKVMLELHLLKSKGRDTK